MEEQKNTLGIAVLAEDDRIVGLLESRELFLVPLASMKLSSWMVGQGKHSFMQLPSIHSLRWGLKLN